MTPVPPGQASIPDLPWPDGLGRVVLDQVPSTNTYALAQAPICPGSCWFLGLEQTQGRGRRARPWVSPRGNFHASLLIHPNAPAPETALRSFVAAVALRDALDHLCPGLDLALKWPNDVLLNGGKLAGILLETGGAGKAGVAHLAVGIGVNLIAHPNPDLVEPGALRPVSLLEETGIHLSPETLLAALGPKFHFWEHRLQDQGFGPLRQNFLTHAVKLGEKIIARTETDRFEGIFETIDLQGNLILRQDDATRSISAADIFF